MYGYSPHHPSINVPFHSFMFYIIKFFLNETTLYKNMKVDTKLYNWRKQTKTAALILNYSVSKNCSSLL